jgi:hypothetical protein
MLIAARDGSEDALSYLTVNAPYALSALDDRAMIERMRRIEHLGDGNS